MNANMTTRLALAGVLALSLAACQKSDDKKSDPAAPVVTAKDDGQPEAPATVVTRQQAEEALASVGYAFVTKKIYTTTGAPMVYSKDVSWDTKAYREFHAKLQKAREEARAAGKTEIPQNPTMEMRIGALTTYVSGMEAYLAQNVPAQAKESKDEGSKESTEPKMGDDVKDSKTAMMAKGSDDSEAGKVEEAKPLSQDEYDMLQSCVTLAKARLSKLQDRAAANAKAKQEQKGEDSKEDSSKGDDSKADAPKGDAPAADQPSKDEPKK